MKKIKKALLVTGCVGLLIGCSSVAEAFNTEGTIEETVIVDENDIKITATQLNYDDYDVSVSVIIENNSSEDLSFRSGVTSYSANSVNGYMIDDGYVNVDVTAGKKTIETVDFDVDTLAIYGITEIADIELAFCTVDDDYDYVYYPPVQIVTQLADSYDYDTDTFKETLNSGQLETLYGANMVYNAEDEVYNQDSAIISAEAVLRISEGDELLMLEMENQSDRQLDAYITDVSVNGLTMYSGTWSIDTVNPGKRAVLSIASDTLYSYSYPDLFGLDAYGQITFDVELCDVDGNILIEAQTITLTVSDNTEFDTSGDEIYNANGITIISKGLAEDTFSLSDDIHLVLLVKNEYGQEIIVDDVSDTLSINGFMRDSLTFSEYINNGQYGVLDIEIDYDDLTEIGISSIDEITDAEISVELRNSNYDTIDEPTFTFEF